MNFIVTTTNNHQEELAPIAHFWAMALQKPCVARKEGNINSLMRKYRVPAVLVATITGPKVYSAGGKFFYHPSMAQLRLENIKNGGTDHLVEAMNLQEGMRVLDCTLGLASDAAVASFVVGNRGKVVGLEYSDLIAFTVARGLGEYVAKDADFTDALKRINVICADAQNYLATCQEKFDVVYFDPMFETPVQESSNMQPLRELACDKPITKEMVDAALKIAPRVVIKERYIKYLRLLGCQEICGGKYSTVKYGVRTR